MTRPLRDTPTMCGVMGCLKTRPCSEHGRKAWATTSTKRTRGSRWQSIRRQVIREAHGKCAHCPMPGAQVDHVTPLTQGGTDDLSNLQLLCIACHDRKTKAERRPRQG